MKKHALIKDLREKVNNHHSAVKKLKSLKEEALTHKPEAGSWSALECIEHLNRYSDFYIPEIEEKLEKTPDSSAKIFHPGRLGNYFVKSMLPSNKMKKMRTFRDKNPESNELSLEVLDVFLEDQKLLLNMLKKAEQKDLTKIRLKTTLGRLVKLRLGDVFRFLVNHQERHVVQAKQALSSYDTLRKK